MSDTALCLMVFKVRGKYYSAVFDKAGEENTKSVLLAQGRGEEIFSIDGQEITAIHEAGRAEARKCGINFVVGLDEERRSRPAWMDQS
jgi:hypothetical protein